MARNSNVQDAFVIAVEQQARERLEKLSALKKIKPVDMTKLSQELNECTNSTPDLNGVIENNPIYVTTVPEIHNATLERVKKDRLDNYVHNSSSIPGKGNSQGLNGHSHIGVADHEAHDQELELTQEIVEREVYDDTLSPSSPETPPRERLLIESQNGVNGVNNRFSQLCVSVETLLPNLPDKLNRSSPNENHLQRRMPDVVKTNGAFPKNYVYRPSAVESELRTHREMAVDVPDSFVGVAKTAPRYPPQKVADSSREGHPEFFINSSGDSSSNENEHNSKLNSLPKRNGVNGRGNLDDTSVSKFGVDSAQHANKYSQEVTQEELERIRKYEVSLRNACICSKLLMLLKIFYVNNF